jgi:Na+:H+ antiporter
MTPTTGIEFLLWLLIAASVIAVIATRVRVPYTVALVMGGLVLGAHHFAVFENLTGGRRPDWLTPDVILILFLPALLFEGSLRIRLRELAENGLAILLLASAGVVAATVVTGYAMRWAIGLPIFVALIFGALVSPTDPISVLALFRDLKVTRRLSIVVEAESLLNDGTAVVLFSILLAGWTTGKLGIASGIRQFFAAVLGGAATGVAIGYAVGRLVAKLEEPEVGITLTTIVAYGSYLLAHRLGVSGVIATVASGVMVGNFGIGGKVGQRTRVAILSFWEYAAFVINSVVFLLIGMEVHVGALVRDWRPVALAIGAVLLGRVLTVYGLAPLSNRFSAKIPLRWQHVLVWGGLRGSLCLAMALSLAPSFPYRGRILELAFGVVAFSIIVQGLTIKPLLRGLGLTGEHEPAGELPAP